ncbi:MAG: methyltransferase domain-containing protein [Bryobacteraceae bacterium]|jgi:ubiquinone/menaquinone biosynthesis C-methylase UbiE
MSSQPPRTSQAQFDRQAPHYNAEWNAWNEKSLQWLVQRAQCRPSHYLLDVATGTGFTAVAFASLVAAVTGVDVSEGMLEQARAKARAAGRTNVVFQTAPAEALPFPPASFDRVVSRVAPHHFLSIPKFLAEAHRVLRPGGRLLVADTCVLEGAPELDAWQNHIEILRDPSHIRSYAPSEWRAFVTAAGFALEELDEVRETAVISMRSWLEKAGCRGENASEVRRLFLEAPPEAARMFTIALQPDGDIAFRYPRVALSARKPE